MRCGSAVRTVAALLLLMFASLPVLATPAAADPSTLTVDTLDVTPFVISEDGLKSGFSVDVFNEVATRRGWTITYGTNGSVSEILTNVAEGRADVALGAIEITSDRARDLDFSQPLYSGGLQIMVPAGTTTSRSLPGLAEFL